MKNLPKEYQNVFITYETQIRVRDKYYDHYEKGIVTRRAFYTNSKGYYDTNDNWIETPDGYFCVPQYWGNFTFSDGSNALLPQGFQSFGRVSPSNIIKWENEKPC